MVTEQMKTDAQRFGNGKKGYNIKQVAEMLENVGGGYTAGDGITISEDKVISAVGYTAGDGINISEDKVIKSLGFIAQPSSAELHNLRPKFVNSDDNTTTATLLVVVKRQFNISAFIVPKGTYSSNTNFYIPTDTIGYGDWKLALADVLNPPESYTSLSNNCYLANKVTDGVVELDKTSVHLSFKYVVRDKGTPPQNHAFNVTSSTYYVGLYSLEDFE